MKLQIKNHQNFLAGLLFTALGGGFAVIATDYRFGTAARMGPGFFPVVLGVLLAILGLIIAGSSIARDDEAAVERIFLRPFLLILGPVALFGLMLRTQGLLLSGVVLILGSAFASSEFSLRYALPTAIVLTVGSYLIFVYGLGLPIPVLPEWL